MDYFQLLKKQAQQRNAKKFIITAAGAHSYQEVYQDVLVFAQKYQAVFPQQHTAVLIFLQDVYDQLVAFLGCMALGQVPVLAHFDLPRAALQQLKAKNSLAYSLTKEGLSKAEAFSPIVCQAEVCMGVLSSGSTDVPKVMYRTYASWADFFPEQNKMFLIEAASVVFLEGSMSFTGNLSFWAGVLYAGATVIISEKLNCRRWLWAIETYQVKVIYLVPTKLRLLAKFLQQAYPSVQMLVAGSQLLETALAQTLKKGFPQSQIILYYGASELNYITALTYEELLLQPLSVGKAVPGVKVTAQDGYIYVDTPYHVEGINCPYTLQDRGYFNSAGYLIFQGRAGDVVNKGGFKINCTRVLNVLLQIPGVQNAVVLPYGQKAKGAEIAAFLVTAKELSQIEVRQKLKKLLQPAEIPKKFFLVKEIPLNSLGKVNTKALRALIK